LSWLGKSLCDLYDWCELDELHANMWDMCLMQNKWSCMYDYIFLNDEVGVVGCLSRWRMRWEILVLINVVKVIYFCWWLWLEIVYAWYAMIGKIIIFVMLVF